MVTKAIDISYWQGEVSRENFEKVKKDGIKSVIQRSGYTSQSKFSLNTDSFIDCLFLSDPMLYLGIVWYLIFLSK